MYKNISFIFRVLVLLGKLLVIVWKLDSVLEKKILILFNYMYIWCVLMNVI